MGLLSSHAWWFHLLLRNHASANSAICKEALKDRPCVLLGIACIVQAGVNSSYGQKLSSIM